QKRRVQSLKITGVTMSDTLALKPDLGRYAVWTFGSPSPEQAVEIERLGYGAIWVGGSPAADLTFVEPLLAATSTLQVATGIINIWSAPAGQAPRPTTGSNPPTLIG